MIAPVPASHVEYLENALGAEPFADGYSWRGVPRGHITITSGDRRFWYLVDGVAKRCGWGHVDDEGAERMHQIALRIEAKKIARAIAHVERFR